MQDLNKGRCGWSRRGIGGLGVHNKHWLTAACGAAGRVAGLHLLVHRRAGRRVIVVVLGGVEVDLPGTTAWLRRPHWHMHRFFLLLRLPTDDRWRHDCRLPVHYGTAVIRSQ